jgi:hypothetical protein
LQTKLSRMTRRFNILRVVDGIYGESLTSMETGDASSGVMYHIQTESPEGKACFGSIHDAPGITASKAPRTCSTEYLRLSLYGAYFFTFCGGMRRCFESLPAESMCLPPCLQHRERRTRHVRGTGGALGWTAAFGNANCGRKPLKIRRSS